MHNELVTDISTYTLLASVMVAVAAGMLGCFVVWRKMAYFGDSLSHGALLGIVLGIVLGVSMNLGIFIVSFAFAAILLWLQSKKTLANDTILGILAHSALATGLVVLHLINYPGEVEEHALLFGSLTSITGQDFIAIAIGAAIVLLTIFIFWEKFVISSISEDLAQGEGINVFNIQLIFIALVTIIVAISIKLIGIVLITSLMIIPAATSRQISSSPRQMAAFSALFGVISVIAGLQFTARFHTPSGPSMVVCATAVFIITALVKSIRK